MQEDQRAALDRYLAEGERARWARVDRALAVLEPRELSLLREGAVMGYVRGTLAGRAAGGGRPVIPPDSDIVAEVVGACLAMPDLYPLIATLGVPVPARRPHEELAAGMLAVHVPRCCSCGQLADGCGCAVSGWECTQCAVQAQERAPEGWPCPTMQLLGRWSRCENVVDQPDWSALRCPGWLVVRPGDPQGRCLTCGAWCGALAARYVELGQG